MHPWQKVFREGLVPVLSTKALEGIKTALETDDPRLIHNQTAQPLHTPDADCECACLIGFAGMVEGLQTVDEVITFFSTVVQEIDKRTGVPESCRELLRVWDCRPRDEIRPAVLEEVKLALAARGES